MADTGLVALVSQAPALLALWEVRIAPGLVRTPVPVPVPALVPAPEVRTALGTERALVLVPARA